MKTSVIKVEGMSCGHCKKSVESALLARQGIESAEVTLAEKTVSVVYNEDIIELLEIKDVIEDIGFEVYL
jgi:copper chaperone